jgi:hypothetical protein
MTINRALSRLVNQGLRSSMCPLCHVAHKLDREYMWHFFDEYSDSGEAIDQLRAAGGFCAGHAAQLRAIEVDGLSSTLGISTTYLETLEGISRDLDTADPTRELPPRAPCPACAYRDDGLARQAAYLHAVLDESETARERFSTGPGLCLGHLRVAWAAAAGDEQRSRVLAVDRNVLSGLAAALREHIRDNSDGRRPVNTTDPPAWELAIHLTAGWPAPR